ncbi:MAG TPA: hypothetical protein VEC95_03610 [Terriglobales bacterium]|nr:hypothetical protein [Terriglobales bacterium]
MSRAPATLEYPPPPALERIQKRSLVIGVLFLAVAAIAAVVAHRPTQFFRAYLLGFMWWVGMSLGCLAVLMMQHVAGGQWGYVIRRPLEAAARMMPLLAVMFLPLIFGIPYLYVWDHRELVQHDAGLRHQLQYLTAPWFVARSVFCLLVWILLAYLLNGWSAAQDSSGDPALRRRMSRLSGPGLGIYALTLSIAGVDWLMSLSPHWASTVYPLILIAGQILAGLAFSAAILSLLVQYKPMSDIVQENHVHSLGKMMLAFVMLWAYCSYSQLVIIWAGNQPSEISWYLPRLNTGWKYVALALVVFHFAVPFALLLSRDLKRDARRLARVAILLILMRYVDLLFWIAPDPLPGFEHGLPFQWMDIVVPIGIGAIWMAAFAWALRQRSLLAVRDQRFEEVVGHVTESA